MTAEKLENDSAKLFQWFLDNQMKANKDKCHFLKSRSDPASLKIDDELIKSSTCEKLLGIKVDYKLTFSEHLNGILKKASCKINALSRIVNYMSIPKRRILMNSFFISQFSYCPLVWMCHSRAVNNKINSLHERCLRIVYNDKKSSFEELLEKDNSVSIHHRNLQVLATEMFKVHNDLSPAIVRELFHERNNNYNLRQFSEFAIPNVKSVHHGSESISVLGPKIWNLVPNEFRELTSLTAFKKAIKKWKSEMCPCRLCKEYVQNVGFI